MDMNSPQVAVGGNTHFRVMKRSSRESKYCIDTKRKMTILNYDINTKTVELENGVF